MNTKQKIIIVGGGLSGLTLAYLLSKENIPVTILEASSRLGGRIETLKGKLDTPLELGATWFFDVHQNLISILDFLGIKKFPQYYTGKYLLQSGSYQAPEEYYVGEADTPSYRIKGGTQHLTDALSKQLKNVQIELNAKVKLVRELGDKVNITTEAGTTFEGDKVIICMPPQLIGSDIQFSPKLPEHLTSLLPTVHTWMAGSIKFVVEYASNFWRPKGYSGMIYTQGGIIAEMYDHTNFEEDKFGFTGFLNGGAVHYTAKEREKMVIEQVSQFLGKEGATPVLYKDKIWTDEHVLGANPIVPNPHQNNGHPLLLQSYFNQKLWFAGTETDAQFPGKMEGAILSALRCFKSIIH